MNISLEDYEKIQPVAQVEINGKALRYRVPNKMTYWRVETLLTKEPITIEWLNSIKPGEVLLDVGANVGMYTIYAAVARGAQVVAVEPESQNYALLNANIHLNGVSSSVTAYCLGLSNVRGLDKLYLSGFQAGTSCHSVGEEVGFDLKPRHSPFVQGIMAMPLDEAVESGAFPVPDHIKIDVDGFEHKVIQGALKTIADPKVKSIIVELNPDLSEHRSLVRTLEKLGFSYDPEQVQRSARTEGTFTGVGEWVFERGSKPTVNQPPSGEKASGDVSQSSIEVVTPAVIAPMTVETSNVLAHVLERVQATPVDEEPFAHMVIDNIFPDDYYQKLQQLFPEEERMRPLAETGRTGGAYKERLVTLFEPEDFAALSEPQRQFWSSLGGWLYSREFMDAIIAKFPDQLAGRLADIERRHGKVRIRGDALIVSDKTDYAIGPHTDAPHRLVSFLFYLPKDERWAEHGTSLYRPLDPNFHCAGGPHHKFEGFERVKTVGFVPNRLVIFAKSDVCFHGVEQVLDPQVERHLLINNIRLLDI
jgi:FkbM family methyltransferase